LKDDVTSDQPSSISDDYDDHESLATGVSDLIDYIDRDYDYDDYLELYI